MAGDGGENRFREPLQTLHQNVPSVWQASATGLHLQLVSGLGLQSGASCPDSPSQEIVQKTGGEIRIRLFVYDTPDVQNVFRKYGEDSWG